MSYALHKGLTDNIAFCKFKLLKHMEAVLST